MRADHQCAGRADRQRVAIGWRFREDLQAKGAAGARLVLDENLPVEPFAKLGRNDPGDAVGGTAGWERDDNLDGLLRALRKRRPRQRQGQEQEQELILESMCRLRLCMGGNWAVLKCRERVMA